MKKLLPVITAAITAASAMLVATAPMTLAAETDYEKLIPDVKNRLNIPEEYSEFTYQGISSDESGERYSFRWSKKDADGSIRADVSENGDILSYHTSDYAPEYDYLSADSSTETKAREYTKILLPDLEGDIRLEASAYQYGAIDYDVYLGRNGIEYRDPIGSIGVKSDGTLDSASFSPVALPDEDTSLLISSELAYAQYMISAEPKPVYNSYHDKDDELVIFPVYSISSIKAVSALSGDMVEMENSYGIVTRNSYAAGVAEDAAADMGYKELSESEQQEIARVNNLLSKEKIIKLIEEKLGIKLNDNINSNLYISKTGGTYNFYSYDKDTYTDIRVDAKTGDITNLHINNVPNNKLTQYDFSDKESVKQLISNLAPASADGYEDDSENWDIPENGEGARFIYKVNGIEVAALSAYALKTGDSYSVNISEVSDYKSAEYASPDTFIGTEKAFWVSDLQLKYAKTENGIEAVYMPSDFTDINAQTGKRVNYRNEDPQNTTGYKYSDINDHWIRPTAEKLALAGIGFKGGEFKPEDGVTEALAAEIIRGWRYYYDRNKKYDEETLITRRTAADMFVKGLGYEKLIGSDVFKMPYLDTPDNYSSIAMLKGMGIIASDTEIFRPEDNITRAEFMQMIYNAITAE
ncbi:MAG: S-layer homology domain-containing protein [Oscillospiraceae bacterium]|nr:S-layer homology domain-containing protein [Oscillospiraceae bacterium]